MRLFELFENMGGKHFKGATFSNHNRKGYAQGEDVVSKREAEIRRQIAQRRADQEAAKSNKVDEAKTDKKKVPATTPRNFVAKNAKTSGAGSHSDKKYNRKEKHKNADSDE
jgi:hypothetical protein